MKNSVAHSWAPWEKYRYRTLVILAVLTSAAVASAASNERRMFAFPGEPAAFTAVPQQHYWMTTTPVAAYLVDGCQPNLDRSHASFGRTVDEADCGEGRAREPAPIIAEPEPEPVAFFAMPEVPILIEAMEIPDITGSTPKRQQARMFGAGGGRSQVGNASFAPPILLGVPEPGTWALMILGFGLTGGLLRRLRAPKRRPAVSG